MKLLRVLAMLAALALAVLPPVNGWAADEEETFFSGATFRSLPELQAAITAGRRYDDGIDSFLDFTQKAGAIYMPAIFVDKAVSFRQMFVFQSYIEVEYLIDGEYYLFQCSHPGRSSEVTFQNVMETYFDEDAPSKGLAREYHANGRTVYAYYDPNFSYTASDLGESHYVWRQDGLCFSWRIPDRKLNEGFAAWCEAVAVPLGASYNPSTGR